MRLLTTIKYDVISQFRHGFYFAYLFVSLLYIILLKAIPESIQAKAETLILFSDPVVLGFYFIGGVVLLEKSQNTMDSLFVTPMRIYEYIFSKVISLSLLTVGASLLIAFITSGFNFKPLSMLIGVTLSSVFFTLLGFTLAVRSKTLNSYLITSSLYTVVFFLPVLNFLQITDVPLFSIIPGNSALKLIEGSYGSASFSEMLYAVLLLLVWTAIAYIWAQKCFYKYIVLKIGGR